MQCVMTVVLPAMIEAALVRHARESWPQECCGLLIGSRGVIAEARPVPNRALDPTRQYEIDPRDLLGAVRAARGRGLEVIGAYHSHPRSPARPSPTDAAGGFEDFLFVIVGLTGADAEVTAWRWMAGNFASVPLVRTEEQR
jgi:proteasome lid subunit RPN8/RPN11